MSINTLKIKDGLYNNYSPSKRRNICLIKIALFWDINIDIFRHHFCY
jgi:hypothetical protein